ncbi:MAG: toxin-antitoxin system antitoxin subunit [Eggerthellaceae bacterium]|nr:toxin-antitoxin system antitoxin subunit [Eggerthellaceae bacterium]
MEFKTASGAILTDAMLDEMAQEYEDGTWEGCGEVTMGRPKLYDEDMETVSFRLPKSRVAAVEAATARKGISKSEFYRRAVDRELLAIG